MFNLMEPTFDFLSLPEETILCIVQQITEALDRRCLTYACRRFKSIITLKHCMEDARFLIPRPTQKPYAGKTISSMYNAREMSNRWRFTSKFVPSDTLEDVLLVANFDRARQTTRIYKAWLILDSEPVDLANSATRHAQLIRWLESGSPDTWKYQRMSHELFLYLWSLSSPQFRRKYTGVARQIFREVSFIASWTSWDEFEEIIAGENPENHLNFSPESVRRIKPLYFREILWNVKHEVRPATITRMYLDHEYRNLDVTGYDNLTDDEKPVRPTLEHLYALYSSGQPSIMELYLDHDYVKIHEYRESLLFEYLRLYDSSLTKSQVTSVIRFERGVVYHCVADRPVGSELLEAYRRLGHEYIHFNEYCADEYVKRLLRNNTVTFNELLTIIAHGVLPRKYLISAINSISYPEQTPKNTLDIYICALDGFSKKSLELVKHIPDCEKIVRGVAMYYLRNKYLLEYRQNNKSMWVYGLDLCRRAVFPEEFQEVYAAICDD